MMPPFAAHIFKVTINATDEMSKENGFDYTMDLLMGECEDLVDEIRRKVREIDSRFTVEVTT